MKKNKKKDKVFLYLLIILGITVGYALLSTTLKIIGTAGIKSNTWNIHWENVQPNAESTVTAETPSITENATKVSYEVTLELPGDYYEFTVDAKNDGSINGEITKVDHKVYAVVGGVPSTEPTTLPSYINYSIYYDGTTTEPAEGDILASGAKQTYRIRIEYDPEATTLPPTDLTYKVVDEITYTQTKKVVTEPNAVDEIEGKVVDTPDGHNPVRTTHHETDKTPDTPVNRYMGADPDNYIYFNCDNESAQTAQTCEMWRIIGTSYDGYIKIIKNDQLSTKRVYTNRADNDWGNSDLSVYLNGDYYNGLKYSAKKAIAEKTWFTNGWAMSDYGDGWGALPEYAYIKERSNTVRGNGIDTSATAKVGLMYASDFGFASQGCQSLCPATASSEETCSKKYNIAMDWDDPVDYNEAVCRESNWLYKGIEEWTMTPNYMINRTYYAIKIFNSGDTAGTAMWEGTGADAYIRPVVYLNKDTYIYDGNGTQANPYKIKSLGWNLTNPGTTGTSQRWEYWEKKNVKITSGEAELKDFGNNNQLYHFKDGYVVYGWHKLNDKVYYSSPADTDGNGYTDGNIFRGEDIEVTNSYGATSGGTGTFTFAADGECTSNNCPAL